MNIEITISPGWITNRHGIPIRMCCASCNKREINNGEGRYCKRSGEPVAGSQYCEKWRLHPRLQNAGMSGGRIKCIDYLNYYRKRWIKQYNSLEAGRIKADELLTAADIRREYEKEQGPIYIKH